MVMAGAYPGVSAKGDGRYDPVRLAVAYYAPVVYSGFPGLQPLALHPEQAVSARIELWFKAQDDCLRAQVCEVLQVSPATRRSSTCGCVPPACGQCVDRSTQPLGIVVDQIGPNVLMSYTGTRLLEYCRLHLQRPVSRPGRRRAGGLRSADLPRAAGLDTGVHVQNLESIVAAKVKVYFVDHNGGIITTLVDWVCPRGEQTFFLPLVNNLPGNYVGAIRVESQEWESPGDPFVNAVPIAAVAELIQYSSPRARRRCRPWPTTCSPRASLDLADWRRDGWPRVGGL